MKEGISMSQLCPCGSGRTYEACCQPYHKGSWAENALDLMRSRYSAFVLNLPDYIIRTTHPGSVDYTPNTFGWKKSLSQFSKNCTFEKLTVLDYKPGQTVSEVTFTAHLSDRGQDGTFTEKSLFEKINGHWLYKSAELFEGHQPNLVTTHPLKVLPLAYIQEPVLSRKAQPILHIDEGIHQLIDAMIETMDASDGIGLAAPQVHHSVRLFVMRQPIEKDPDGLDLGEVKVIINPVISALSEKTWTESEGCLSIPGLRAPVQRPYSLTIEYQDEKGQKHKETVSGWTARVILHEFDHLDGILFIDRLEDKAKKKIQPQLKEIQRRFKDHQTL